jgi:hypothetical protein
MTSMAHTHPAFLTLRSRVAFERAGKLVVLPAARTVWLGGIGPGTGDGSAADRFRDQQDRLFRAFDTRLPVLEAGLSCNARQATLHRMTQVVASKPVQLFCVKTKPLHGTEFSPADFVKMTDGILKPLALAAGLPRVVLDPGFQPKAQHALGDWVDRQIDTRLIGELIKDQTLVEDLWLSEHLQADLPAGIQPSRGMRL